MGNLKIGWGRREFSTDKPVSIPGQMYLRISEGIHDPLYATAMCVESDGEAVIFCTMDLVSLRCIVDYVKEDVAKRCPELPLDKIIMGVTHTHSGCGITGRTERSPDGKEIFPGEENRKFVSAQVAEAIVEAWNNRSEASMAYGYGYAVVGHSRRVVYLYDYSTKQKSAIAPNGHGVMYGKTNDEWFSGYEAGADHFMNLMFTFDKNEKLTGIVVNVPCPSQLSEHFTKLSADYWNEVRQLVQKEYGQEVYVLPQCAAAGDLSPRILHYKEAQARRMALKYDLPYDPKKCPSGSPGEYNKVMGERYDIAERICDGIREVYAWAKKDIQSDVVLRHSILDMPLSRRMISPEERDWCEQNIKDMESRIPDPAQATPEEYRKAISTYNAVKGRNERAIGRYETQEEDPTLNAHVHVVRVGEIAFATTRYELYQDFMHRLQARSPFLQTFVVQLAGDEGGNYLATEKAKQNKGYSASLFCNMVSPEGGQEWVENVLEALNEMV